PGSPSARRSTAPGHDPDQGGEAPADQRIDGDGDDGFGYKDIVATGRRVEDAMKRSDEHLGQVVNKGDEAGLGGRAKELEQEANDQQRGHYSRKEPDSLFRPQAVRRSIGCHRRCAVFACLLHGLVTDDLDPDLRAGSLAPYKCKVPGAQDRRVAWMSRIRCHAEWPTKSPGQSGLRSLRPNHSSGRSRSVRMTSACTCSRPPTTSLPRFGRSR